MIFEKLEEIRFSVGKKQPVDDKIQALDSLLSGEVHKAHLQQFKKLYVERSELTADEIEILKKDLLAVVPNANFTHLNPQIYAKLLPYAKLMQADENNGIPEEHAYKLAVLFTDENKALSYLKQFQKQNPDTTTLLHDACLFALPQGNFELKTWQDLAQQNLGEKEFREYILPQAAEIEVLIKEAQASAETKATAVDVKKAVENIEHTNAQFKRLKRRHGRLNADEESTYQNIGRELMDKRLALTTIGVPFNKNFLSMTALSAFREKYIIQSSAAYKYFLQHGLTKYDYSKFIRLKRQDDDIKIPKITIAGDTLGYPGYYLMKVPVLDEMHAARAACFGKLTSCCQSLSGEAGEACVIHGLTSQNGGFYVLCKGDPKKPSIEDEVMAQCWAWRSKDNALVLDSIEMDRGKRTPESLKMARDFYRDMSRQLVRGNHSHKVVCGSKSGISKDISFGLNENHEEFIDYEGYTDSTFQLTLFDPKNYPFYWYGQDEQSTALANEILNEAIAKIWLMQSTRFAQLINYANRSDIFNLIKSMPQFQNRLAELELDIAYINGSLSWSQLIESIKQDIFYINTPNNNFDTPLLMAIKKGDVEAALFFIEKGADVNASNKIGETALMLAMEKGYTSLALALINKGADVNAKDIYRHDAMMWAIRDHSEFALTLMEKGYEIDLGDIVQAIQANNAGAISIFLDKWPTKKLEKVTSYVVSLAVEKGYFDLANKLSEQCPDLNFKPSDGMTPLLWAVKKKQPGLALKLITLGADPNVADNYGKTPLAYALDSDQRELALKLLEKGAHAQPVYAFKAVEKGDLLVADNLIKNLPEVSSHVVFVALKKEYSELAYRLFEKSADPTAKDDGGYTALMLAILTEQYNLSLALIEKSKDLNAVDGIGRTALIWALVKGKKDIALKLIEYGADTSTQDTLGKTARSLAQEKGFQDVIQKMAEMEKEKENVSIARKKSVRFTKEQKRDISSAKSVKGQQQRR